MRSNLITAAAVVAGIFLAAPMATAADVQEQLRLMEQRMAEMEDRLQATSDELRSAKETVNEQQAMLSDAGLASDEDRGIRSAVGSFLKEVEIGGVAAASYNYRFIPRDDDQLSGGNVGLFRHPDANTFALDQIWLSMNLAPTEERRGGFNMDLVYGKTAFAQGVNASDEHSGLLYTGYVSYLAPIGNGVQFDAGKLATPLGAEVLKTDENFNVTTGLVFGLQPVTHVGVQASTALNDNVGLTVGVVNDVYTQNNFSIQDEKAGYAQLSFSGEKMGLNVGAIVGSDSLFGCEADSDCNTSVVDVVLTADPTENLSMWLNFDWARSFGQADGDTDTHEGDAFGLSGAGRVAINDMTGFATRVEYVRLETSFLQGGPLTEVVSLTGTIDRELVEGLKLRLEARWDRKIDNGTRFVNGNTGANNGGSTFSSTDDQVVGLAELAYSF